MRDVVVGRMVKLFVVLWPILFTLIPCFHCQPHHARPTRDCPYKGLLVLRPLDPVFQANVPARICCQTINSTTGDPVHDNPTPLTPDLKISCQGRPGFSITPLSSRKKHELACASVTFTGQTVGNAGYCVCETPSKPKCQGSQFVSVDAALPGSLEVACVAHTTGNVTCTTLNMPSLLREWRATAAITWTQIGPDGSGVGPTKSKVCSNLTSCTLDSRDGIYDDVLPVTFNMSVQATYEYFGTWLGHHQTVPKTSPAAAATGQAVSTIATAISQWMTLHIQQVQLGPLRASIAASNATTVTVEWDRQHLATFKDSIVIIYYHADQDGWTSFDRKEIREKMESYTGHPSRVVLYDLRPSTTYMMALRARTTDSDILSDPVYLTGRTRSSAGG